MTGTGTQADPFIVDNWADFRTINNTSENVYVKWADVGNKVIDFNDIQPSGFSATVKFPAHVDFNGWTLKNFTSTAGDYSLRCDVALDNLILENFYSNSQYLFYGASLLKNCIMSGIMQYNGNAFAFGGCGFQNCSLNLRANANSVTVMSTGGFLHPTSQITNSDIVLDILCNSSDAAVANCRIKNSRISGKIEAKKLKITLGNGYSMSNIFNIEANFPLYYQSSGISVYNSDFAEKSSDSNQNFIGVTSEQLKNAEYLYNLGFPIGVE